MSKQQKSPAGQGEASGKAHSTATISAPSVQEVQPNPKRKRRPTSRATRRLPQADRHPKQIAGDLFRDLGCPCGERLAIAGPKAFIDAIARAWDKRHAGH